MRNSLLFLLVAVICSCSSRPDGIVSKGTMEDILYDYHLAQSMASRSIRGSDSIWAAFYAKHGMSVDEFDANVRYYAGNARQMEEIYENLDKRYQSEKEQMGLNVTHKATSMLSFSDSGDTIEIWPDARFLYMSNGTYSSVKRFEVPVDTSFYVHDRIEMMFSTHFLDVSTTTEKMDLLVAAMVITYDNDSISAAIRSISSNQVVDFDVRADSIRRVKSIEGYLAVGTHTSSPVICDQIALYRIHGDSSFPYGKGDSDTVRQDGGETDQEGETPPSDAEPKNVAAVPDEGSRPRDVRNAPEKEAVMSVPLKDEPVRNGRPGKARHKQ